MKARLKQFLHKNPRLCLMAVLAVVALVFALAYYHALHRPSTIATNTLIIPKGASAAAISTIINAHGIPHNPIIYRLEEWRRGRGYAPKAGEFALPKNSSLAQAMDAIHKGEEYQHAFTLIEGVTTAQFLQILKADGRFSGDISVFPNEGSLLPETYFFTRNTDRNVFIKRLMQAQNILLAELWKKRQAELPLKSPSDALILASIIEKETALAAEKPRIASVFINRLNRGMRLQSDPTAIYGLEQDGQKITRVTRRHLRHDSAWNTYRINGLPPTPICNPSRTSIEAALNPEATDFFYFVADGGGGHIFAKTLAEHNKNIRKIRGQGE